MCRRRTIFNRVMTFRVILCLVCEKRNLSLSILMNLLFTLFVNCKRYLMTCWQTVSTHSDHLKSKTRDIHLLSDRYIRLLHMFKTFQRKIMHILPENELFVLTLLAKSTKNGLRSNVLSMDYCSFYLSLSKAFWW